MPEGNQTSLNTASTQQSGSLGPTVGIVIIVIIMLVGAVYFLADKVSKKNSNPPAYIPGDQV